MIQAPKICFKTTIDSKYFEGCLYQNKADSRCKDSEDVKDFIYSDTKEIINYDFNL